MLTSYAHVGAILYMPLLCPDPVECLWPPTSLHAVEAGMQHQRHARDACFCALTVEEEEECKHWAKETLVQLIHCVQTTRAPAKLHPVFTGPLQCAVL